MNTSSRPGAAGPAFGSRAGKWLARLLLMLPVGLAAACSSDEKCSGTMVGGQCQAACVDSACPANHRCIHDNSCAALCAQEADCPLGTNCLGYGWPDGTTGTVCVARGDGRLGANDEPCAAAAECDERRGYQCIAGTCRFGRGEPCAEDAQCDQPNGYRCLAGSCRVGQNDPCTQDAECDAPNFSCIEGLCTSARCNSHADCASIGHCAPTGEKDEDGRPINLCEVDEDPHDPGQWGTRCPNLDECADGFVCQGASVGDFDAYCTTKCTSDGACPIGYYCGEHRTQTVNERRCLKKGFCADCETDADCLGIPNQICARDLSGAKTCTVLCDLDTESCPWGNAAICDVWDEELGEPTCAHRYQKCRAGGPVSCGPCQVDDDCGSNGACIDSGFSGERFCVDLDASCSCTSSLDGYTCVGGGCPQTPGGLAMTCYGGPESASSSLYNKCVGANSSGNPLLSQQTGCWPP